jgi:hypothetical protein
LIAEDFLDRSGGYKAEVDTILGAIKQIESGGNYNAKARDEGSGAYQFMPETWSKWTKEYTTETQGKPKLMKMTPENQDAVARWKVEKLVGEGYEPKQIAAIWNSGGPDTHHPDGRPKKGVNKYGVAYDVPGHVAKFDAAYGKLKGSGQSQAMSAEAFLDAGNPSQAAPIQTAGLEQPQPSQASRGIMDFFSPGEAYAADLPKAGQMDAATFLDGQTPKNEVYGQFPLLPDAPGATVQQPAAQQPPGQGGIIEAEMPDGTVLEFPAGTQREVIDRAAKQYIRTSKTVPLDQAVDKKTGVSAKVRSLIAGGKPEDQLATLRKFYPDAQPYGDDNFVFTNPKTGRATLANPKGFDIGDVAEYERAGWEVVGGGIGGSIGAAGGPAAPLTVPLGIGLGAGIGGLAHDIKQKLFGRVDSRTAPEVLGDAATDVAINAAVPPVLDKATDVVKGVGGKIVKPFKNTVAGASPQQLYQDFTEAGIRPSAGAVSGNKGVQMVEKALSDFPTSASIMQESAEQTTKEASKYADTVAGKFGKVSTPEEAGRTIQEAAKGAVNRFKARAEKLYDDLYNHLSPDTKVAVSNTKKMLDDEIKAYSDTPNLAQRFNKGIMSTAGDLAKDSADGTIPFKTLQRLRSDVGDKLGDAVTAVDDLSRGQLKKLYGALSADIEAAAKAAGPDAAKAFERANRYYRMNRSLNINVVDKVLKQGTTEQAFNFAMGAAKNGGSRLRALRRNFSTEAWDEVAGTVLGRMGRANPGGQNVAGDAFSVSTFLTNWNKLSPGAKEALFGGARYKGLQPELDRLTRIVGSLKKVEGMANSSKTGGTIGTWSTLMASIGGIKTFGTAVAAPFLTAKAITNPRFVKWLGTGAQIAKTGNQNRMSGHIARLAVIAKAEPAIKEEMDQLQGMLFEGE